MGKAYLSQQRVAAALLKLYNFPLVFTKDTIDSNVPVYQAYV
jgi:hypothetical protein